MTRHLQGRSRQGETNSFEVAKQKVLEIAKEALKANSKQYLRLVLLSDLDNEVEDRRRRPLNRQSLAQTRKRSSTTSSRRKMHVSPIAGVRWARTADRPQSPAHAALRQRPARQRLERPGSRKPQQRDRRLHQQRRQGAALRRGLQVPHRAAGRRPPPGQHRHQRPAARDALHRRGAARPVHRHHQELLAPPRRTSSSTSRWTARSASRPAQPID